jgi:hypothetical protein
MSDPRPTIPAWRRPVVRATSLLAVVVVALYAGGLRGEFVCDDRSEFVENDVLPRLRVPDVWQVFVRPVNDWGDRQPIRDVLWVLELNAFGPAPAGFHAVSLVLYAALCALVFLFARRLLAAGAGAPTAGLPDRDASALAVALLFAVHPVHVETVAYVTGQKDLLYGTFSLAALVVLQRAFDAPERRRRRVAAGVLLCALALLSKQTAIALAALVPLVWWTSDPARRPGRGPTFAVWGAATAAALGWVWLSQRAMRALFGTTMDLEARSIAERAAVAVKVLGAHARLAVVPRALSFGYPFDDGAAWDRNLAAGLVALAVLLVLALRFRRDPVVVVAVSLFFLFLVPVMQLTGTIHNASVYDRYLLLPVLGLALLVERAPRARSRPGAGPWARSASPAPRSRWPTCRPSPTTWR